MTPSSDPKPFRTPEEKLVGREIEAIFSACPDPVEVRLESFPKYVRRQHLTRFLAQYEIFRRVLGVKGSIIECGVHRGFGLMTWAKLSAVLEPVNLTRRVYGFDSFRGFPAVHEKDAVGEREKVPSPEPGGLAADSYAELLQLISLYDRDRFLGHISKVELIKGNAVETVPQFLRDHPHLVVSLLFMDFDLYEPTRVALQAFLPRMPRGAILAFDELDNPIWPGETMALLETVGIHKLALERLEFDPYIGFAVLS